MSKLFSSCLLVQEDSSAPELKITDVDLHPGNGFTPDHTQPLIAGGFSSISPECGFPLSPTLQLNHDLTSLEAEELLQIAVAELHRKNSVNYRSYTVDMDNRACVIGSDAAELKKFFDIYGGVVVLEPLLLKGYDAEIPTVTKLNLESQVAGCRLEYQVRSPIDFRKCTYCGECGAVCPENCISENLFVNYDVCSLCKECEKVCDSGAIDIHSVVDQILEVPAVIMLGDLQDDMSENGSNVFSEEDLSDFFSTLAPCQIDEVVSCDNSICQFSGRLGKGCDLCLSSCRSGAVRLDGGGVSIDALKCEECGACVAVCPTGALQNERFNDANFFKYLESVPVPEDGTVVLGDETALHRLWWNNKNNSWDKVFFLQYENVKSLSLFHFFYLLNRGIRKIVVLQDREKDREKNNTSALQKQIDFGSKIITKLYDYNDAIVTCGVLDFTEIINEPVTGRIDASGNSTTTGNFTNRRMEMSKSLEGLVVHSGREVHMTPSGYIPFATVSCNRDRCTECMACLNDCRIGALTADQENLVLSHIGTLCVGCGLCVRVCPEDALSISSEFTLAEQFFAGTELARAEAMACKSCGKVFGTKKSFDRVMAILKQKEAVDTSHFEYCETCRVVKLFESE
ncbi:MAG: 4Fe-4S dicluster domain-containing protein [Desulfobulbaceae bacterium]|nr:4Fe-4S dicluster domain-containing protein [Desulfobulbaceae bacterium]